MRRISALTMISAVMTLVATTPAFVSGLEPARQEERQLRGLSSSTAAAAAAPEKTALLTFILQKTNLSQLCDTFKSLYLLEGDKTAPIIVFDSMDITTAQKEALEHCVSSNDAAVRRLKWQVLNLKTSFPYDLLPHPSPDLNKLHFDTNDWSPQLMDRFLTYSLWMHPALRPYSTVMRINDDSCFTLRMPHLPHFSNDQYQYSSALLRNQHPGVTDVNSLYAFATNYVQEHKIPIAHAELWAQIQDARQSGKPIPAFQNELEVVSKEFMQRDDVQQWHAAVTEYEPHGVFRHDWSTGYIRIFTVAMFLTPSQVNMEEPPAGYVQKEFRSKYTQKPIHYQFCSTTSITGNGKEKALVLDEEDE